MDALTKMLAAKRPYKPFDIKIGDETVTLYARKPGTIENARISRAWEAAYTEKMRELKENPPDFTSTYAEMKKKTVARLAQFIVEADTQDILQEASALNDDKPFDDEAVVKEAGAITEDRLLELMEMTHEDVLARAWERREHYRAAEAANTEASYERLASTVYAIESGEYKPLFYPTSRIKEMDTPDLVEIIKGATSVLVEETPAQSPLPQAPSPPSDEPSSSPSPSTAE